MRIDCFTLLNLLDSLNGGMNQGCINRPRIGEDFSSETSLPSFPHIGNVGITRKTMESTAELILCGS